MSRPPSIRVAPPAPDLLLAIGSSYEEFGQSSGAGGAVPLAEAESRRRGEVRIPVEDGQHVLGDLIVPHDAGGLVVFAHGSGSSRHSPRNRQVAAALEAAGHATLLIDLLTPAEEPLRANVFDIELLARRLLAVTRWIAGQPGLRQRGLGYFGASTGAGAALWAAADAAGLVQAVVSRGGRPDLAAPRLADVRAPTLLIVGGRDDVVIGLNRRALTQLRCPADLQIVPGATHLFEEPGTLEAVQQLAAAWFTRHLRPPAGSRPR